MSLLEGVLGSGDTLDLEITAGVVVLENQFDFQINARGAAHPRARPQDAPAQPRERLDRGGDIAVTPGLLTQREQGAPDPHDGETFGGAQWVAADGPDIARPEWAADRGTIPDEFPGRGVGLQPFTKELIFPP